MSDLYIGLMSGTSLDGVDGVIVDYAIGPTAVLAHTYLPFPVALAADLLALNSSGVDELHRAALAANSLVSLYAQVVHNLLKHANISALNIAAIGAHGQTVRHRPQEFDGTGYTLQLNNPALLAELTGIDVAADFRSRDVAAGGQGAPLVPGFHRAAFGGSKAHVAVLNIGGIANLTVLGNPNSESAPLGFDCGPGNALMDEWCRAQTGQNYDAGGEWASNGSVHPQLLAHMLTEPFFAKPPPKSTGRDLFNPHWLRGHLARFSNITPVDVQATLAELTASTCSTCVNSYSKDSKLVLVCGGGALNTHLMRRLQAHLPNCQVASTQARGLPPMQVEAAAFAWLARQTMLRQTASIKSVTGAKGARILGAVYPA